MIKHAWTAVCEKSIIDKESNNISLDILEQLTVEMPPISDEIKGIIFPFRIEVVSLWYRPLESTGAKYNGRLRVQSPLDETLSTIDLKIDLTSNHRYRTRVKLNGIPINKNSFGYYYFIVEVEFNKKWTEVSKVPLEIRIHSHN